MTTIFGEIEQFSILQFYLKLGLKILTEVEEELRGYRFGTVAVVSYRDFLGYRPMDAWAVLRGGLDFLILVQSATKDHFHLAI